MPRQTAPGFPDPDGRCQPPGAHRGPRRTPRPRDLLRRATFRPLTARAARPSALPTRQLCPTTKLDQGRDGYPRRRHLDLRRPVARRPGSLLRRSGVSGPPPLARSARSRTVRPARKPAASTTSTASLNLSPTRQGWCASLPNDTARPRLRHQRSSSAETSGLFVFISRIRPLAARARSTARYSASKAARHRRPPPRPHPPREVHVREHLERAAALDQPHHLGEVPAHHLVGGHPPEQRRRGQPPAEGQRVHRAEDPVEAGRASTAAALAAHRCASPISAPDRIRSPGSAGGTHRALRGSRGRRAPASGSTGRGAIFRRRSGRRRSRR